MHETAAVCQCTAGTLQVRREQDNLQKMPRPLLSSRDEKTDTRSDAMGRPENDMVSPCCRHQTFNRRTIALNKQSMTDNFDYIVFSIFDICDFNKFTDAVSNPNRDKACIIK